MRFGVRLHAFDRQFNALLKSEMRTRVRNCARLIHAKVVESMSTYATQKSAMEKHSGSKLTFFKRARGGGIKFLGAGGRNMNSRNRPASRSGRIWVQVKTKSYATGDQQVTVSRTGQVRTRARRVSYSEMYFPSKPGEVPHVRTGKLKKSLFWSYDNGTYAARIGTPLKYGMYLEGGTRRMAARPFLLPALVAVTPSLTRILVDTLPGC